LKIPSFGELVASFIIEPKKLIKVYANRIERLIRLKRDKNQMSRFGKRFGLIHPEFGGEIYITY
jgi:hypothetical protein